MDGVRFVRRGTKLTVYARGMRALLPRRARRPGRRGRRAERTAVLHPAGDPQAGGRPGPPRAPGAVAGRLPRADRPGRLVDRAAARALALPPRASTSRSRGRPATSCASSACADRGSRWSTTAPTRTSPVDAGKAAAPDGRRGRPAGPAQAGRARHRRRRGAARTVAGPAAARRRQRLVGGPSCTSTPTPRGRRRRGLRGARRRGAQARGLRAGLAAGAALAQGGVGAGGRRGRHARARPTVAYRVAGGTRESVVDGSVGRAGRRPRPGSPRRSAGCSRTRRNASGWVAGRASHEPRVHLGAMPSAPSPSSSWPSLRGRAHGRAGPRTCRVPERTSSRGEPG